LEIAKPSIAQPEIVSFRSNFVQSFEDVTSDHTTNVQGQGVKGPGHRVT